jgi:hypothetical protein
MPIVRSQGANISLTITLGRQAFGHHSNRTLCEFTKQVALSMQHLPAHFQEGDLDGNAR